MNAVICALNLSVMLCDLSPLAAASGTAPEKTPLLRHAKTLRRALLCVPARITRHARQNDPALRRWYRHLDTLKATWAAAYALPPPSAARRSMPRNAATAAITGHPHHSPGRARRYSRNSV
jgi:hypothetical protein